ncbi:putative transcription factor GRAS family [Helianthus annuus]|nr:putative transcription factor GRAS family [Helianthus annuus]
MKLPFVSSITAEPKSVLDIRWSPPSPVTENSSEFTSFVYDSFEHGMINNQVDEWDSDSLMRELGLYDDSNNNSNTNSNRSGYHLDLPIWLSSRSTRSSVLFLFRFRSKFEPKPFDLNNLMSEEDATHTNEFDYRTELTRLAECFETQSFQLAQVILSRLNQWLHSPTGKTVQGAAFYFKEAIQNLFSGSTSTRSLQSCTLYEILQVIKAYQTFSTVYPILMFSSFQ